MKTILEALAIVLVCGILVFAGVGVLLLIGATPNVDVVKACEQNGYWQTGQTRIICHKESPTDK